jgi:hypothetical protein
MARVLPYWQKTRNLPYTLYTNRDIGDVLSINNHNFHNYVHLIYPNELEIKDTTESDMYASYLDILYSKRDDSNLAIINLPYLCSLNSVYISQFIPHTIISLRFVFATYRVKVCNSKYTVPQFADKNFNKSNGMKLYSVIY